MFVKRDWIRIPTANEKEEISSLLEQEISSLSFTTDEHETIAERWQKIYSGNDGSSNRFRFAGMSKPMYLLLATVNGEEGQEFSRFGMKWTVLSTGWAFSQHGTMNITFMENDSYHEAYVKIGKSCREWLTQRLEEEQTAEPQS